MKYNLCTTFYRIYPLCSSLQEVIAFTSVNRHSDSHQTNEVLVSWYWTCTHILYFGGISRQCI